MRHSWQKTGCTLSEFHVRVFRLGKVGKHPNADSLSITQGPSGYPVVFKTGEFSTGDLAVHIPVDALVDTALPAFSWLSDKASLAGDGRFLYRVKATKLRGVPSYGFLVPMSELWKECPSASGFSEGQLVDAILKVEKYEPGPCFQQSGVVQGEHADHPLGHLVPLYDIEGMRRYKDEIVHGEMVSVTEKIHGSNGRWGWVGEFFLCGSRTKFRKDSVWNLMAEKYDLKNVLQNTGYIIYGEVYGKGIQDMEYGLDDVQVVFFDLYDRTSGRWLAPERFFAFCLNRGLPTAPELYRGPYDAEAVAAMAEGQSTLPGANHVREGVVVKPLTERRSSTIGRVFLKQPGEGYLLRNTPEGKQEAKLAEYKARTGPIDGPDVDPNSEHVRQLYEPTVWGKVKRFFGFKA